MTNQELVEIAKSVSSESLPTPAAKIGGVGSALVSESGRIYKGKSIDCSCGIGFCAEHSAIAAMVTANENRIMKIVAVNEERGIVPPCGRCRELIAQINFANLATQVILENEVVELRELLPHFWLERHLIR